MQDYLDPNTDNNLHSVLPPNTYAARVNDSINDYTVSVISQTASNYSDPKIYFAWAAGLQSSHNLTDSDNFTLQLTDVTKGTDLYSISYGSASAAGTSLFTKSGTGWYYTPWQLQTLDVSALQGDTFILTLLASDCPYGGNPAVHHRSLSRFAGGTPLRVEGLNPGSSP